MSIKFTKNALLFIAVSIGLLVTAALFSQEETKNTEPTKETSRILTLQECIDLALNNNQEIAIAKIEKLAAQKQLEFAKGVRYFPKLSTKVLFGPVPEAKGDIFYSPDSDNLAISDLWSDLSFFTRAEADFLQPIFTFGKLSSMVKAAQSGLDVSQTNIEGAKLKVTKLVKQIYFGIILTKKMTSVADESRENLQKAQNKLQELLDEGSAKVSEMDRYKLDIFSFTLDKQVVRIESESSTLISSLKLLAGISEDEKIDIASEEKFPKLETKSELNLNNLIEKLKDNNNDLKKLKFAIKAKSASLTIKKSDFFPNFFVAGGLRYSYSPGRDDQHNPFVNDDFNFFNGGLFLGLEQKLNFWSISNDVSKEKIEYEKLQSQQRLAKDGLILKLHEAYNNINKCNSDITVNEKALKATRAWLKTATDEFEGVGGASVRDLTDAFTEYIKAKTEYYKSMYEYNSALSELEVILGESITI